MADNTFLQGAQLGANLVSQGWQRQERMIELRAQAAQQAIRERESAARIGMLMEELSIKKKEAEQEQLAITAGQSIYDDLVAKGATPEEAFAGTIAPLSRVSPSAGLKMSQAYENLRQGQMAGKTTEHQRALEGAATARVKVAEAAQAETARHNKAMEAKPARGTIIRTNPDGTTEIVQGAEVGPDALTRTNQSKVQEAQAQSVATIDVANRLEPLISNETVGVQAFAESWVKDRILAQRFPEMASEKRAKAEQLAAQLRATAVKELRSDSNITEGERKQILGAIPNINDPVDSPARAKELVRGVKKMAAIRALVAAKRMGGSVPKPAAMALDDEELVDLFNQGLISQEIAAQAYQLKRGQ